MNAHSLRQYYIWSLKALLFVLPFLSLWITSSLFFPYITGRNFAFRILIALALVLWGGLMVFDKRYRPRSNLMLWAVVAFTAIVGIADFLGVDPYTSFWSRFERMEGYMMILHLVAYFLILTSVFKTKREWLSFFTAFVTAGALVGGYGVLQILGIKEAIQGGGVRIDGTIGNPTYLAVYLVLISALAFVLFFNATKKWQRYTLGTILVFNFFILYFTASRGAALALLVAIPIFLLLYLIFVKSETSKDALIKKIMLGTFLLIILAPLLFLAVRNAPFVKQSDVLSRFSNLSFGEKTVRSRFAIWGMTLRGVAERPLLGWGQENYMQVFAKYFDPKLYDQEPWFDRPHNIVLEWLINAGIIGLTAYLFLYVAYYILLFRAWRGGAIGAKEGVVLTVAPIAYFIQNVFVFDNYNTYILFFGLLGYVGSLNRFSGQPEKEAPGAEERVKPSLVAAGALLIILAIMSYFITIKPIRAAGGIIASLQATTDQRDPVGQTISTFRRTLELDTFGERETLEQLARVTSSLLDQDVPVEVKQRFFEFAVPRLESYIARNPNDIRVHLFTGSVYLSATTVDASHISRARDHFEAARVLSPTKQQIYGILADSYLRTGELQKAIELIEESVALEPSNIEAHANRAIVAIFAGRNDIALDAIDGMNQARLNAPETEADVALGNFLSGLQRIVGTYLRVGDAVNARAIFEQLLHFAPNPESYREQFPQF